MKPIFSALLLAVLSASAFAQGAGSLPQDGPQNDERRHKPPEQAIQACVGKTAGTVCTFTGPHGQSATGSCFKPPARGQEILPLACHPDRPNRPDQPNGFKRPASSPAK